MRNEAQAVLARYKRRTRTYDPLDPAVNRSRQEFERALIRWLKFAGLRPVSELKVLEFGCGTGGNLLQLLRLGFRSENLVGNELQASLAAEARHRLPIATEVIPGDALDIDFVAESFDVVIQSLVFSSVLDDDFRRALADKMWELIRPGGGVLWYDMAYDNPANADVRGISYPKVKEFFPAAEASSWRITLAPPLSRIVTRLHPVFYDWLNCVFFLRTHRLCWLKKK